MVKTRTTAAGAVNKQNMKVKFKISVTTTTTTRDCVSIFVSPKLNQLFKEML